MVETARKYLLCLSLAGGVLNAPAAESPAPDPVAFFEKKIRPLLIDHCYECHSASAEKIKGGLLLDSRDHLRKGGDHGPVIDFEQPTQSRLIIAVQQTDEKLQMPPQTKLADHQIDDLITWVRMGAPDPREQHAPATERQELIEARQFWSFRPVLQPVPPTVQDTAWPKSPLDQFILAELEKRELPPVPMADRHTLIRRVTFDLIGLPPTPREIEDFVEDPAAFDTAWARVVDRLLASPHYGERWGRHWMDLVRYADTAGDNSDYPVPQLYRYRNYIIDAFNQDIPYDQFIREQIAGDLLPASDRETKNRQTIATGYIALSRRFGSIIDGYPQHLTIEDTIDNLGRTFLGLTINCARCHDHKFDAISKEDYYGLYGIFNSTRYPFPGIELDKVPRDLVPLVSPEDYTAMMVPYEQRLAALDEELKTLRTQKKEASKASDQTLVQELTKKIKATEKRREEAAADQPLFATAYAMADGEVADARVQVRGDPKTTGDVVPRKFLNLLGGQTLTEDQAQRSGRKELADWITHPQNPLTARVMANRIWQYHFGSALVKTPSDFGTRGQPPTHPALLDWLADRFMRDAWSIKSLHRVILMSRTYQLSSQDDAANLRVDPDNDFHWRFNRQRLDAEQLRDAVMFVAGSLNLEPAREAHPFPPVAKWQFTQHHPFKDEYPCDQRSVYMMQKRLTALPYFQTFDGPDPNASTADRDGSVTTVQALYLLNSGFVEEQALAFASRLMREHTNEGDRLTWAFRSALGRHPSESEIGAALDHIRRAREKLAADGQSKSQNPEELAWASFASVLLRINEFLYID